MDQKGPAVVDSKIDYGQEGMPAQLHLDADHYNRAFQAFNRVTDRENALKRLIEETFMEGVVARLEPVCGDAPSFTLKTLGVGCGSGVIDWTIMSQLSRRFPTIAHTVLEPHPSADEYRALVARQPIASIRTWNWRNKTWQQFTESESRRQSGRPVEKYHSISAISVVYYLHPWRDSLLEMYERLEEGGILIITASSEQSGFLLAVEEFPVLKREGYIGVTSDLIRDYFASQGIPSTYLRQDCSADISCCFGEDINEAGSLILDFFAHVKDFEKTCPAQLVADFRAYLKSPKCSRPGGDGSAVMLTFVLDTVIVKKEQSGREST